tara:strand:- start:303 stop:488 length:186 start_codon:yes stop_codon:yes gene_type:complete
MTILDKKLLQILVCPVSRKPLVQKENELFCFESKLAYPVKDGIPIMIPEKARKLSEDELKN